MPDQIAASNHIIALLHCCRHRKLLRCDRWLPHTSIAPRGQPGLELVAFWEKRMELPSKIKTMTQLETALPGGTRPAIVDSSRLDTPPRDCHYTESFDWSSDIMLAKK